MVVPESFYQQLYKRPSRPADQFCLDKIYAVLQALRQPQLQIKTILIAGTNGKGSTSAALQTILSCHQRTGLFTSPHLLQFKERIRIDQHLIDDQAIFTGIQTIAAIEKSLGIQLSFFEVTTALALWYFAQEQVNTAVMEVGLGGRLDATNVCEPSCTAITPIGFDHQAILGNSLGAIAREKAGIMRENVPVVIGRQLPEAWAALATTAHAQKAPLVLADLTGPSCDQRPLFLNDNLALAVSIAQVFAGYQRTNSYQALSDFVWPGRYQWLSTDMLIDGAHNPHAITALLQALTNDNQVNHRRMHLCFAAFKDKQAEHMLTLLRPHMQSIHCCPLRHPRSLTLTDLQHLVPDGHIYDNSRQAVQKALATARLHQDIVIATGSLALIGEVLAYFHALPIADPVNG